MCGYHQFSLRPLCKLWLLTVMFVLHEMYTLASIPGLPFLQFLIVKFAYCKQLKTRGGKGPVTRLMWLLNIYVVASIEVTYSKRSKTIGYDRSFMVASPCYCTHWLCRYCLTTSCAWEPIPDLISCAGQGWLGDGDCYMYRVSCTVGDLAWHQGLFSWRCVMIKTIQFLITYSVLKQREKPMRYLILWMTYQGLLE